MVELDATPAREHLDQTVLPLARKDFPELRRNDTVQQALDAIRKQGVGEKVVYFYVMDDERRLAGVLPTRRLLTSPPEAKLADIMISRVVALPHTATILDACEMFVMHRFLAFPVIDEQRHVLGIVDVSVFTEEVLDLVEKDKADELFDALGFHVAQVRSATPWNAFRLRFPWLAATLCSGLACAVLASAFEQTIARAVALTFFLTLVLALGESVAIQSMAIAVQGLRSARLSFRLFLGRFGREMSVALLLGLGCGAAVYLVAGLWRGFGPAANAIGGAILGSVFIACGFGLIVPSILHWLRLDPKVAAGPITLALTDICTLLVYFSMAKALL